MTGILLGAALATRDFAQRSVRRAHGAALDACGLLAALGLGVAWATLRGTNPFLYHGGFWLTELGALALIACAIAGERSLVARALAIRPLTWLGTISYGVYLWHWPVNVFFSTERTHLHGLGLHALALRAHVRDRDRLLPLSRATDPQARRSVQSTAVHRARSRGAVRVPGRARDLRRGPQRATRALGAIAELRRLRQSSCAFASPCSATPPQTRSVGACATCTGKASPSS